MQEELNVLGGVLGKSFSVTGKQTASQTTKVFIQELIDNPGTVTRLLPLQALFYQSKERRQQKETGRR